MNRSAAQPEREALSAIAISRMIEHLGRALATLEQGHWQSFRNHLAHIREQSAIADIELNGHQPADPHAYLTTAHSKLRPEWAATIVRYLSPPEQP
ncbi:hypothetical protein ACIBKY_51350 [Nonomuraea sp. NPDC050394]|uniref:hypothetical protein n=1 Tax=Nonomuraea sp. NPDC050394 TaxID=3364363 RepID=UPI0037A3F058